jgi:hypothetical protein
MSRRSMVDDNGFHDLARAPEIHAFKKACSSEPQPSPAPPFLVRIPSLGCVDAVQLVSNGMLTMLGECRKPG